MKIILAPDSFKESATAWEVCLALEKGIQSLAPETEIIKIPMADGGEGFTESLVRATKGTIYMFKVAGPDGKVVNAHYGILGDNQTGVFEMASASGIQLIPKAKRNPLLTSSYGTGQLLLELLNHPVKEILIGIGGSATNDAGWGMLKALGMTLKNQKGEIIEQGGGKLIDATSIEWNKHPKLRDIKIKVACDVKNPLCGSNGASYTYGYQKGATKEQVEHLDKSLSHFADLSANFLGKDFRNIEGAGAAGGLGFALTAFLEAELKSGVDLVMEYNEFEKNITNTNLIITGEGSIDNQTQFGKTPFGVAQLGKKYGIPVIALAGKIGEVEALYNHGFTAIFPIVREVTHLETTLFKGKENLEFSMKNIMRLLLTMNQFNKPKSHT